ncbi:MAG: 50S ribosomal protein L25/general stress protein Ctc [Simkania sp.]|nr:50S ribosomal protein L25/general stress protein Ctc [Simkania sp.]MCP5490912.1 50S ribosomal protein L25/general stress protein Ctc [Chlamydiales bacterium]
MKLKLSKRSGEKKSELTQIRFRKDIPAVIYQNGKPGENAIVNGSEFHTILRGLQKGYLPTTIFELDLDGKKSKAIVKDIQYHPTTYQILHLDFLLLSDDVPVDVKVPISFEGQADCVGIKLGGFLRPVIRHVRVRCLPKDIPTDFKVDVRSLAIGQEKRIRDIEMSDAIRSLVRPQEVVVVIAKR